MNSCYIPDLTERFPEGLDGVDMTDRYFPGSGRNFYDMEDAMWQAMADDYYSSLEDRMRRWWDMSDEEFQKLADDEKQEYYDDQEEWNEYQGTEGPEWFGRA